MEAADGLREHYAILRKLKIFGGECQRTSSTSGALHRNHRSGLQLMVLRPLDEVILSITVCKLLMQRCCSVDVLIQPYGK